ncbi:MAG: AI-2E family transporter [Chloroflexi bacterium]|nr:AI-2E family transporter [Chloroflexota bacterium]
MELSARDRALLTTTLVLLVAYLAFQLVGEILGMVIRVADVLLVFLVAWAFAYLLLPLVDLVDRRTRLDRLGAVAVVYLAIALVLTVVLVLGIPAIAGQLAALTERGPEFGEKAAQIVLDLQQRLAQAGVRADIGSLYGALPERIAALTGEFAKDALGVVAATGALLFNATLALIIAFLMLVDGERLWDRFTHALSDELRSEAELLRQSADRSFGGFLRASLLLGLIYGVAQYLILRPLDVPFAGLLATVAGLAMIVPFFGPIIAAIPVFAATVLGTPDRFLPVFVLTLLLQQVVLNVIGPRLMANVIGIHPIFVFLAILLGAKIAGFWGVLLAMPVTGIANSFARYAYQVARGRHEPRPSEAPALPGRARRSALSGLGPKATREGG